MQTLGVKSTRQTSNGGNMMKICCVFVLCFHLGRLQYGAHASQTNWTLGVKRAQVRCGLARVSAL